ncbi:MAG: protein-L-isoaspartate(D-aspartate) O-methyltransferase [Dehalococcoidales bacterium]|jgi:protein-L-isoaspartate(D-aspartate) O-methyltransferase|nr:protein-L-isoaspartate(D-aspartate) O-methyltransferase [Dehalococcoidales bacterium]MDX9985977.1 protein-L-isoaspartate(D-aspartate) O-methyltransferase [Dehalococcoidales bacterium]NLE90083.1 protein-L-isoaspartate(D-aspartate) O-methyltransferase [Dehalococcoidales bacterium]
MIKGDNFESRRAEMVANLESRLHNPQVIAAISRVPRHLFVPSYIRDSAYEDSPLPIGYGQTISQPYIVALMTSELALKKYDKVLEIGTGSGYQAAILAELTDKVFTVERIPDIAKQAAERLSMLGYKNIEVKIAAGELGWKQDAPYDAILVAAASPNVPDVLIDQLKENGRMVIPVGDRQQQELLKVTKRKGEIEIHNLGGCRFVALIGEGAWKDQE